VQLAVFELNPGERGIHFHLDVFSTGDIKPVSICLGACRRQYEGNFLPLKTDPKLNVRSVHLQKQIECGPQMLILLSPLPARLGARPEQAHVSPLCLGASFEDRKTAWLGTLHPPKIPCCLSLFNSNLQTKTSYPEGDFGSLNCMVQLTKINNL
jgi:hypothetical protein